MLSPIYPDLHWTVDFGSHSTDGAFTSRFWDYLQPSLMEMESKPESTDHYTILPNFWNGYHSTFPQTGLGQATIHRQISDSSRRYYQIHSTNGTSGEELKPGFQARVDAEPQLLDGWQIEVTNHGDGIYAGFRAQGRLNSHPKRQQVVLEMPTGLRLPVGEATTPIICDWMLFDLIPTLTLQKGSWTMLEDLQRLRPNHRITRTEDWTFELNGQRIILYGYSVFGTGTEVSYWWLNAEGKVLVISKTFSTYVLAKSPRTDKKG